VIAHHRDNRYADEQAEEQQAEDAPPADDDQGEGQGQGQGQGHAQYAPPPADPADEIEHLAQLHSSGVLTDDEFATAKAKVLAS
jgi:hypothetical protein